MFLFTEKTFTFFKYLAHEPRSKFSVTNQMDQDLWGTLQSLASPPEGITWKVGDDDDEKRIWFSLVFACNRLLFMLSSTSVNECIVIFVIITVVRGSEKFVQGCGETAVRDPNVDGRINSMNHQT